MMNNTAQLIRVQAVHNVLRAEGRVTRYDVQSGMTSTGVTRHVAFEHLELDGFDRNTAQAILEAAEAVAPAAIMVDRL
jgi:hypothetical protein